MWKETEFWKETQANAGKEKLNESNFRKPHRQKVSAEFEDKFDKQEHWYRGEGGEITVDRTVRPLNMNKRPSLGIFV